MRELIQAKVEEICDEQGIELDTLSTKEVDKLYLEAEAKAFNYLADMRDGIPSEDR